MLVHDEIMIQLKHLENSIPTELTQALGAFSWINRLWKIEQEEIRLRIYFYSDGLVLNQKMQIEKLIQSALMHSNYNVVLCFERKDKSTIPKHESKKTEANQSHHHSHKHEKVSIQKKAINGVKRIIAVASGKGGVGKSTVSVNLALALHNQGYKVGILDADIYGPSVPTMLNIHQDPSINENNKIIPLEALGLKVMSFGFFAPEETAVIWRGPMIMKALQQFFWDVDWGELDFLIIDLPPGTGDAQLTLVQSIPISGSVIVTTPQNIALLDAVKAIAMFRKTDVSIIGIIENMSTFSCPACGTESNIFGHGGGERVAEKFEVPLLGHIPLIPEIRAAGDLGEPLTCIPGHGVRIHFAEIAEKIIHHLVILDKISPLFK